MSTLGSDRNEIINVHEDVMNPENSGFSSLHDKIGGSR